MHAYEAIRQGIVSGKYRPGSRLVADQLARELDVSKVPVREALRHLAAEGLVELIRNVGAQVQVFDERSWQETMVTLGALEGLVMAESLPGMQAEQLREARRINDEMRRMLDDLDPIKFTALNREFHFTLYASCQNRYALTLVESGWDRLDAIRRSVFSYVGGRAVGSVAEHDHLVDLIERAAPAEEIDAYVRAHRTSTVEAFVHRAEAT